MNRNSNEAGMVESSRLRKSGAVAAQPSVAHASDKRLTKGVGQAETPETDETAAIRDYWAAAKASYQRGGYPDYGSAAWKVLPLEDPRKMAGLVAFAQMWLRYGDEIADDLNRQLRAPQELVHHATPEACAKAAQQIATQQQRRKEAA